MDKIKRRCLKVFLEKLKELLGEQVEVVVVGSYARGTQTPESDVDVVVVVLNVV